MLRDLVPVDPAFARVDDLRALLDRLEPAPADFAPAAGDFAAPLFARDAVERELEPFARDPADFARDPADLRAPPVREADADEPDVELVLALLSIVHLPDITRWAASATASAMSEPSLVALAITLLAA